MGLLLHPREAYQAGEGVAPVLRHRLSAPADGPA